MSGVRSRWVAVLLLLGCSASRSTPEPTQVTLVEVQPPKATSEPDTPSKPHEAPAPEAGSIDDGRRLFAKHCVACHGERGEGRIGPNLTDACFIHGRELEQIRWVIDHGLPERGMVSWENALNDTERMDVAAYVHSLAGMDEPRGKACQGKR